MMTFQFPDSAKPPPKRLMPPPVLIFCAVGMVYIRWKIEAFA